MNGIERRILAYIEQHGGKARRDDIVCDLASPESRIGRGILNGSNAGTARLFGAWAKRLLAEGLVVEVRRSRLRGVYDEYGGYYDHHEITDAGRKALRS